MKCTWRRSDAQDRLSEKNCWSGSAWADPSCESELRERVARLLAARGRTAAIKVIKPGMDSRQVIARFDAERQAMAIMEHPNIVTSRAWTRPPRNGPCLFSDSQPRVFAIRP